MRRPSYLPPLLLLPALLAGCKSDPVTDYRPLDNAGMWSSSLQDLKKLNVGDTEIAQLVALKNAGVNDDLGMSLVQAGHDHQHRFVSAAAAASLSRAGFSDEQILAIALNDKLDALSSDAVMLRLVGLTDPTIQMILHRRMQGLVTMSSAEIGRLKNTGRSEKEIVARIQNGMADAQADAEAAAREKARAHSGTGFVRVHGRRR